jgi:hypothetical protein
LSDGRHAVADAGAAAIDDGAATGGVSNLRGGAGAAARQRRSEYAAVGRGWTSPGVKPGYCRCSGSEPRVGPASGEH